MVERILELEEQQQKKDLSFWSENSHMPLE